MKKSVVTLHRGDKDVPNGTIPLPELPQEGRFLEAQRAAEHDLEKAQFV